MEGNVQVIVRLRPHNGADEDIEQQVTVSVNETSGSVSLLREKKKSTADYKFTAALGADAKQSNVYQAANLVNDVLQGINCCVMAYGCTGSGKTYTMCVMRKLVLEFLRSEAQRLINYL